MLRLGMFITIATALTSCATLPSHRHAKLGEPLVPGREPVEFESFVLRFERIEIPKSDRPLGPRFYFCVESQKHAKSIMWTSGTGDIAPTVFSIDDECFTLMVEEYAPLTVRIDQVDQKDCEKRERSELQSACG